MTRGGLFRSFWLGGYEGADHVNRHGAPLDLNRTTGHRDRPLADYRLLARFGIRAVRESVGWRLAEREDGRFDFSHIEPRLAAARRLGLQVGWTLCHYGWPAGLDLLAPEFAERFARFCRAAAQFIGERSEGVQVYSPINEISYLSWALAHRCINPQQRYPDDRADADVKRALVRAALAGCDAVWEVDPHARILHVDPLIHVVAPRGRPDLEKAASGYVEAQYEAWDMLCGRLEPQLGGAPRYLDVIGANYYHSNQWEAGTDRRLFWHLRDPRRRPLRALLAAVYARYRRPLLIAETSHVGHGRGRWIAEIAQEVMAARACGVPVEAVCLYPIIDRPDWDDPSHWHRSGLWDLRRRPDGTLARVLNPAYARHLRAAQQPSPSNSAAHRTKDPEPCLP